MTMIRKNAKWIYETLGKAFNNESPREFESMSNIQIKAIIPEAESRELEISKHQLEIDYVEFEIDESTRADEPTRYQADGHWQSVEGVKLFHAPVVSVEARFSQEVATCSVDLVLKLQGSRLHSDGLFILATIEGKTFEEIKPQVQEWADEQVNRIARTLRKHFESEPINPPSPNPLRIRVIKPELGGAAWYCERVGSEWKVLEVRVGLPSFFEVDVTSLLDSGELTVDRASVSFSDAIPLNATPAGVCRECNNTVRFWTVRVPIVYKDNEIAKVLWHCENSKCPHYRTTMVDCDKRPSWVTQPL